MPRWPTSASACCCPSTRGSSRTCATASRSPRCWRKAASSTSASSAARSAPTTSMRTVYNADWPWQLNFSLHAHMTDEMRLTPIAELEGAVAAAREFDAQAAAAGELAPQLALLQDPAYLAVSRDGAPIAGLSVQLRENRWGSGSDADVSTDRGARPGPPVRRPVPSRADRRAAGRAQRPARRGRRARMVRPLRRDRRAAAAAREHAPGPVDRQRPAQHARRARGRLAGALRPARDAGRAAAGRPRRHRGDRPRHRRGPVPRQRHERHQRARGRRAGRGDRPARRPQGAAAARARGARRATALLDRLLDDPTWPCRANMRTRMHNDVDRYVQIPNPLHGVRD